MEPLDYSQFADVVHWRAVLAVVNTFDEAGRKIVQNGSVPTARGLPLGLRYKPVEAPGHDGAYSGIGSIDRVWFDGNKLMGQGRFDLEDPVARDVVRKIKMGFVRHVSADMIPGKEWKLAAATVLDIPAFEDAQFTAINIPDAVDAPLREDELVPFAFAVVGATDLPVGSRERVWDEAAATTRVFEWADGDVNKHRRAFFYQDEDSDPALRGSYKLPFADVIDGELQAVPRGVFAVAGGHGVNAADIPESDKATIRRRVSAYYRRIADEFDDPGLVAPWDRGSMAAVDGERFDASVRSARVAVAMWDQVGV